MCRPTPRMKSRPISEIEREENRAIRTNRANGVVVREVTDAFGIDDDRWVEIVERTGDRNLVRVRREVHPLQAGLGRRIENLWRRERHWRDNGYVDLPGQLPARREGGKAEIPVRRVVGSVRCEQSPTGSRHVLPEDGPVGNHRDCCRDARIARVIREENRGDGGAIAARARSRRSLDSELPPQSTIELEGIEPIRGVEDATARRRERAVEVRELRRALVTPKRRAVRRDSDDHALIGHRIQSPAPRNPRDRDATTFPFRSARSREDVRRDPSRKSFHPRQPRATIRNSDRTRTTIAATCADEWNRCATATCP